MPPNNAKPDDMTFATVSQTQATSVGDGQQLPGSVVDPLFRDWLPKLVENKKHMVDVIKSVYQWNLTRDSKVVSVWTLDLKTGSGSLYQGPAKVKPDCIITMDEMVSLGMFDGTLDPAKAFMTRKMKLTGNLMAAHKFQQFWAEESLNGSLKALSSRMAESGALGTAAQSTSQNSSIDVKVEEELLKSIPTDGLKSDIVFNIIRTRMNEEPDLLRAMKFIIQFNITRNGKVVAVWTIDTKAEGGEVYRSLPKVKPDAIVTVDDENYIKLLFGKLNPQRAFMTGKIGVKGNILLLQKLDTFWNQVQGQRKDPELPIIKEIMLNEPLKPGLKSEVVVFDLIQKLVRLPNLLINGTTVSLQINRDGRLATKWRLNFGNEQPFGVLVRAQNSDPQSQISLTIDDNDFVRLVYNTLRLEDAIASGRVQYSGDISSLPKLSKMFQTPTIKAKL